MSASDTLPGRAPLASMLGRAAPPADEPPPYPAGGEYQAYARPATQAVCGLHLFFPDGTVTNYQYAQLVGPNEFMPSGLGTGNLLTFRFAGHRVAELVVEGRHLWPLFDYVSRHRMPWVCVLPKERDHEPEDKPVVHRVTLYPGVDEE